MDLLAIYVEDHLALSLGGILLARRAAGENRNHEVGRALAALVPELEEDRRILSEVARALGGSRSILKETAVALGEIAGRFKPNGRLLSYSPLSRVWELEGLAGGSESRRLLWRLLARAGKRDRRLARFQLEGREERARAHREAFERLRERAAREAFLAPGTARVERPADAVR
jgi:hypothetical protein